MTTKRHLQGRPEPGATEVLKLTDEDQWVPDDGKVGRAFSGQHRGFPIAWGSDCQCRFDERKTCPMELAMNKTSSRWSCANGRTFRPRGRQ